MDGIRKSLKLAVGILRSRFRLLTDETDNIGGKVGLTFSHEAIGGLPALVDKVFPAGRYMGRHCL